MVAPIAVPSSTASPKTPAATPIAMGALKPTSLLATSPFEAAFGVKPPASPHRTEANFSAPSDRQYVSMSPAGDMFTKVAAQKPAYFSAQSMRAQFSGFALQALKEQRTRALQFSSPAGPPKSGQNSKPAPGSGKAGQVPAEPPTILYQFSAQPSGGANASSAPAIPYRVGVRVQARFGNATAASGDAGSPNTQYQVDPLVYQPAQSAEGLHIGRQQYVPHILNDSLPATPNAVRTYSGQLRMMRDLPSGVQDVTPRWMQQARQHLQTALTFAGRHVPSLQRYVGYDKDTHTLRFGNHSVSLQRHQARLSDGSSEAVDVTPLRLVRMASAQGKTALATLHTPLELPEGLTSQTHSKLTESRNHAEALADMLGNSQLFGASWVRQPEQTLMTPPAWEASVPKDAANPFKTVKF